MASEITITCKLQATKNSITLVNATYTKTQNIQTTKSQMVHHDQEVGLSREAVNVGPVDITNSTGTEYLVLLSNRDATNFVTVEVQTGSSTYWEVAKLRPGEYVLLRRNKLDSSGYNGLFMTASTAACQVEVLVIEAGDPTA